MMVDLGKYAAYVLSSYGVTLGLIGGLIWLSWRQSAAAKKRLEQIEAQNG